MDHAVVFGVGCTNFRAAVAAADGTYVTDLSIERTRPGTLAEQLLEVLRECQARSPAAFDVGVATTGLVDEAGVVRSFDTPGDGTVGPIDVPG